MSKPNKAIAKKEENISKNAKQKDVTKRRIYDHPSTIEIKPDIKMTCRYESGFYPFMT